MMAVKKIMAGNVRLNRKRITVIVLLLAAVISARFFPGCGEGLNIITSPITGTGGGDITHAVNWADWSYRRSVTISNSGSAQSDYQVNITLTSANCTFANADAGGNDIRFNYNGTSLSYWIESWNSVAQTASVWVKVPSVAAGNTVIYMYYGNTGQSSASNFDNTFTKDSGFSGLVARWHMDEGSGTAVDDSSSNNNDGTVTGASWAGSDGGKWYNISTAGFSTGDSLSFDGTGDYVTVPDDSTIEAANITIAVWVKTSSDVATTTQFIVSKWTESGSMRSYSVGLVSGKIRFFTSPDGSSINQNSIDSATTLNADKWYHITVTDDAAYKKIYINGTQDISSVSGTYNIYTSGTSDLYFGIYDLSTPNYYKSIIDEVSIYNKALTADEVKALSRRSKYSSSVSAPSVGSEEIVP